MGDGRWGNYKKLFSVWDKLQETLEPKTILLYGKNLTDRLSGNNVVFKQMISSKVAI